MALEAWELLPGAGEIIAENVPADEPDINEGEAKRLLIILAV